MEQTRELYKQTESQFALSFQDGGDMDSMVKLTAGADCKSIGISKKKIQNEMLAPFLRRVAARKKSSLNFFDNEKKHSLQHPSRLGNFVSIP